MDVVVCRGKDTSMELRADTVYIKLLVGGLVFEYFSPML